MSPCPGDRAGRPRSRPPRTSRSYSLAYDAVRSSMRYGSASRIAAAGSSSGRKRRAASRVPSSIAIQTCRCSTRRDPRALYDRPRVDLRPTTAQLALRDEAAAFAESVRPILVDDPEWRRQGMLSDGDSRDVTRALGEAGWIGMTWPEEVGRSWADARRRGARRGRLRLPLAPALALPPLVQDDRLRARAFRRACVEGAAPRADRARGAHVLPGLLGARGGERPGSR